MGCARFDFDDLCEQPLGPRDYLAIAHAYHTLVIDGVPRFSRDNSNGAKRFIQLIDTIYDRGMKLVAGFEVEFENLSSDKDTGFEFKRTISRLNEMASVDYLAGAGKD
jgi:cell division protein ZapE